MDERNNQNINVHSDLDSWLNFSFLIFMKQMALRRHISLQAPAHANILLRHHCSSTTCTLLWRRGNTTTLIRFALVITRVFGV